MRYLRSIVGILFVNVNGVGHDPSMRGRIGLKLVGHFMIFMQQGPIEILLEEFRSFDNNRNMETQAAVTALSALAQEARLEVYRVLVRAGLEGLPAGAIGEALGMPAATLSFHLKELKNAGFVRCQRQGRSRIYSPDFSAMESLVGFLTENCCQRVGGCVAGALTRDDTAASDGP